MMVIPGFPFAVGNSSKIDGFVTANNASATSLTLTGLQAGDFVLIYSIRTNSTTLPPLPTGATNVKTNAWSDGAGNRAHRLATIVAPSSGDLTISGLSSAYHTFALAYRGAKSVRLCNDDSKISNGNNLAYPGLPTMLADNKSWVVLFGTHTGWLQDTTYFGFAARQTAVVTHCQDSDGPETVFGGANGSPDTSGFWVTTSVEIRPD